MAKVRSLQKYVKQRKPSVQHQSDSYLTSKDNSNIVSKQSRFLAIQQIVGNHKVQKLLSRGATFNQKQGDTIQRWESPEHIKLGSGGKATGRITLKSHDIDFEQRKQPVEEWPKEWKAFWQEIKIQDPHIRTKMWNVMTKGLTYGEIIALSGDFFGGIDALQVASLKEIVQLIPIIYAENPDLSKMQQITGGRYLDLAEDNISHFSNVKFDLQNMTLWKKMHFKAIHHAMQGDANQAWAVNAAADHYLTDAFSGGHIRVPRDKLGGIESINLHDLDNQSGVKVQNDRGDEWTAYGDGEFSNPKNEVNRKFAYQAVYYSKQDIVEALQQRAKYDVPIVFKSEQLVPYPRPEVNKTRDQSDKWFGTGKRLSRAGRAFWEKYFADDDQVHAWLHDNPQAIGRMPYPEKVRMLSHLLTSDFYTDDMAAVEKIYIATPAHQINKLTRFLKGKMMDPVIQSILIQYPELKYRFNHLLSTHK